MLKHILDKHAGKQPGDIKFHMRVIKLHKSAYERQVHESVMIQASSRVQHILNSRSEYNRCALPRLETKLGERETREKKLEVEEEEKKRAGFGEENQKSGKRGEMTDSPTNPRETRRE